MIFRPLAFALAAASVTPVVSEAASERKIYAHYMGNFPIGYGGIEYHRRQQAKELRHDSADNINAFGGRIVNWPLMPQDVTLTPARSAELEIRRALRAGIDGFAVDAWSGSDDAKKVLSALFEAAERLDLPFELTICLDPACHPQSAAGHHIDTFTESINWLVKNHGDSPKLARRDGKILILGYASQGIVYSEEHRKTPKGPAKWKQISDAYRQVEKNVGQPLFFHFDFDDSARFTMNDSALRRAAVEWAGQNFDAVGGFLGFESGWSSDSSAVVPIVKAGGAEWSQPLWHQYVHRLDNVLIEPGLDKLFRHWRLARETGSTLLQYVTWNDYGEETTLAPGYSTHYTLLTLNRHLAGWWKRGREPAVSEDSLHLVFRRHPDGAPVYPFGVNHRPMSKAVLEVVTLLKAPGRVILPGRDIAWDAPAGLHSRQFPLQVGEVSATLSRGGAEVIALTAPQRVTDLPFRQDHAMVAFSSDFEAHWRADFGDVPPLLYSEYGDIDGDGLPNWFEMYWFGKLPDLSTATAARPDADPDRDGLSNLDEYLAQTNPRRPQRGYEPGFTWDFSDIRERGLSFNPDRDARDNPVWFYRYKHGEAGAIPHDGDYALTPGSGPDIGYAGRLAHLSPPPNWVPEDAAKYRNLHGWIAHEKIANDWRLIFRPRSNAALILDWRSPVDGKVNVSLDIVSVQGVAPFILDIRHGRATTPLRLETVRPRETRRVELVGIAVKKGDVLHFVADGDVRDGQDSPLVKIQNFKIVLQ